MENDSVGCFIDWGKLPVLVPSLVAGDDVYSVVSSMCLFNAISSRTAKTEQWHKIYSTTIGFVISGDRALTESQSPKSFLIGRPLETLISSMQFKSGFFGRTIVSLQLLLTEHFLSVKLNWLEPIYGTSTKPGAKWMDPFYFMMNPRPAYRVEFLPRAGSIDVANRVQRELGRALGFELTGLTRKEST